MSAAKPVGFMDALFYSVVSLHSESVHDLFDVLPKDSATALPHRRFINKPGRSLFITFKEKQPHLVVKYIIFVVWFKMDSYEENCTYSRCFCGCFDCGHCFRSGRRHNRADNPDQPKCAPGSVHNHRVHVLSRRPSNGERVGSGKSRTRECHQRVRELLYLQCLYH